jgi:hypothetical protein
MCKRIVLTLGCALLFAVSVATAGQWDKKTTVTFSGPVELPGVVLPAGTYVFILADTPSSRHVVQVFNPDQNHLYGTFLALPNIRLTRTGDTVIRFDERAANKPQALRAWFYPGDSWGHEFVYPKVRAEQLAETTHQMVLSADVTPTEKAEELTEAPVVAVTPEKQEVEVAQEVQAAPTQTLAQAEPRPAAPTPEPAAALPRTASPLPLIALLGLLSFSIATALRVIYKRTA